MKPQSGHVSIYMELFGCGCVDNTHFTNYTRLEATLSLFYFAWSLEWEGCY